MHIDWFVFAAQIFNFLVLVFLLKYLLYDRIIGAMDARQGKIAARFAEAEELQAKARESSREYEEMRRRLDEKAEDLMRQARKEAEGEKERLVDQARQEAGEVRQRWLEGLGREKKDFLEGLRRRAGQYVYQTIRNVFSDLADGELEEGIVRVFLSRLENLDADGREKLGNALGAGAGTVVVRSAFPLAAGSREAIAAAVAPYTGGRHPVRYETSPGMGAGIELTAHGYKLSWSVDGYLSDLEEKFVHFLREEIRPDAPAGTP